MPWVKLSDDLYADPRVAEAGASAFGLLVAMLCYSNHMLMDGFVPAAMAGRLVTPDARQSTEKMIDRLGSARLLTPVNRNGIDGYAITPDLVAMQPTREQVEADRHAAKARKDRWKEREQNRKGTATERRSAHVPNGHGTPLPDPEPDPVPEVGEIQTSGKGERGKPRSGARAVGAARRKLAPLAVVHHDDDGEPSTNDVSERHATA